MKATVSSPVLVYKNSSGFSGLYSVLTTDANGDLVSNISGDSVESMLADMNKSENYKNGFVMDFDAFMELKEKEDVERYKIGQPQPITSERFFDMLEALPPEKWVSEKGREAFRMSETLSGSLHSFFVRIGKNHFEVVQDRFIDYSVLFQTCNDSMAEAAV